MSIHTLTGLTRIEQHVEFFEDARYSEPQKCWRRSAWFGPVCFELMTKDPARLETSRVLSVVYLALDKYADALGLRKTASPHDYEADVLKVRDVVHAIRADKTGDFIVWVHWEDFMPACCHPVFVNNSIVIQESQ